MDKLFLKVISIWAIAVIALGIMLIACQPTETELTKPTETPTEQIINSEDIDISSDNTEDPVFATEEPIIEVSYPEYLKVENLVKWDATQKAFFPYDAYNKESITQEQLETLYDICLSEGVDFRMVLAIMSAECRYDMSYKIGQNKNGTQDYGPMMINSCNKALWESLDLDPEVFEDNIRLSCLLIKEKLNKKPYPEASTIRWLAASYTMGDTGAYRVFMGWAKFGIKEGYVNSVEKVFNYLTENLI